MKKRYFAFITALLIMCCLPQAVFAKPQITGFKQWFGKNESGTDVTFIEFTVIDRNWEVANKKLFITLYDNRRRPIYVSPVYYRHYGVECSLVYNMTDTGPSYNKYNFVKYSNGRYRVRKYIYGKTAQVHSYTAQW